MLCSYIYKAATDKQNIVVCGAVCDISKASIHMVMTFGSITALWYGNLHIFEGPIAQWQMQVPVATHAYIQMQALQ